MKIKLKHLKEIIREELIKEIGEGTSNISPWVLTGEDIYNDERFIQSQNSYDDDYYNDDDDDYDDSTNISKSYERTRFALDFSFNTERTNTEYYVTIGGEAQVPEGINTGIAGEGYASINFKTVGGEYNDITNRGELFNIMATVTDIFKAFLSKYGKEYNISVIYLDAAGEDEKAIQRLRVYTEFLKKHLPSNMIKTITYPDPELAVAILNKKVWDTVQLTSKYSI